MKTKTKKVVSAKSKPNKEEQQQIMLEALLKKAIGYDVEDVVEEFGVDGEGNVLLSKKKVQTKHIPPDTSAAKLLLEFLFSNSIKNTENMTDEELEEEKKKLLKEMEELSLL